MTALSSTEFGERLLRFLDPLRAIDRSCGRLFNLVVALALVNALFQPGRSPNSKHLQPSKVTDQFAFGRWLHGLPHYKKDIVS